MVVKTQGGQKGKDNGEKKHVPEKGRRQPAAKFKEGHKKFSGKPN